MAAAAAAAAAAADAAAAAAAFAPATTHLPLAQWQHHRQRSSSVPSHVTHNGKITSTPKPTTKTHNQKPKTKNQKS